jgi:hypothetical protein
VGLEVDNSQAQSGGLLQAEHTTRMLK